MPAAEARDSECFSVDNRCGNTLKKSFNFLTFSSSFFYPQIPAVFFLTHDLQHIYRATRGQQHWIRDGQQQKVGAKQLRLNETKGRCILLTNCCTYFVVKKPASELTLLLSLTLLTVVELIHASHQISISSFLPLDSPFRLTHHALSFSFLQNVFIRLNAAVIGWSRIDKKAREEFLFYPRQILLFR